MFKDYNKYLSTSLKVYLFVLALIFILKLVGLDYFGIDLNSLAIVKVSNLYVKLHLDYVWLFINLYLQQYFYISIVCKRKINHIYSFIGFVLTVVCQLILMKYNCMDKYYFIFCTLLFIVMPIIVEKRFIIKRQILYIVLITIYQAISLFIRNINFNYEYGNLLLDSILNLDQLIMLAITYKLVLLKGVNEEWVQEVTLFLQQKMNLKNLLKKLQTNLHNFKLLDKKTKLTYIIYFSLSLIWNLLSLVVILLVAKLNNTLIECIFILTSFWLSKKSFGKPFHLPSMAQCFVVSNLTYYGLNRITTPLGISIIIPILLGVGLSYVTSKLVKKLYKPLYRGMPKELFDETILKVTDKNSDKYKICYDYFILKKSAINLSLKYNYSEVGIRKIKDRVNEQIKKLN